MKNTLFALALVLFISCDNEKKTEEDIDYTAKNEADIQAYVEENNLTAVRSNSGLYYVIEEEGTGTQAVVNSNVTVAYKGYFLNGAVFDQSDAEGITIGLNQVIAGWTEGIAYFKEGGSGILLVPAHLGYGSRDYNGIPGGSVLVFEVTLISVN
jgi:FKBP-type peptidyl-prolyl cis-trans isomerase FkpA